MLPPGNPAAQTTPEARLRGSSHVLWEGLSAELRALTGIDNGYHRCGGLELGTAADQSRLAAEIATWRAEGVAVEPSTSAELHRHEPGLSETLTAGYRLPDLGQIRNPRQMKALLRGCEHLGVRILAGQPVGQHTALGDRWLSIDTPTERLSAGQFVIATGAWTGFWTRVLGWSLPIRPVRGQMLLLRTSRILLTHVLNVGLRYLVPRKDGRILVGATEEEVGFAKANTASAVAGLLDLAIQLVPGLATAELERTWSGLRPYAEGGLPLIGRSPTARNVYVAAGHFRAGLQLSPITAEVLVQMLLGEPTTLDCTPFACDRQ